MKRRAMIAVLALALLLCACAPESQDEPAVTVSATEELTFPPETAPITDVTAPPITEEVTTEEATETAEETLPDVVLSDLPPELILQLTEALNYTYHSYVLKTHTETNIAILGEETLTETDTELRVKGNNAVFRRSSEEGFDHLYLVKNELYREGKLAKYRIGGYDKHSFIAEFAELMPLTLFTGGTAEHTEDAINLHFTSLSDKGLGHIRETLGIGNNYLLEIKKSDLRLELDKDAHMKSIHIELDLTVSADGSEMMNVSILTDCEQTEKNTDVLLELPRAEDYIYFSDSASAALYESLYEQITDFSSSHSKFEYKLRDDMHIKSDSVNLPLTSNSVYAYNNRIGASIEKAFDIADGTGPHKTLTHFNLRRGFSQIDGGSIFLDTTVNKNNIDYTLSRPFETSFFPLGNCTRMDAERSSASRMVFLLSQPTAKSIASDLLLRAGIVSAPELSGITVYTYIDIGEDGKFSAIGYEFSAKAVISGKEYTITRSVRLEIVSRDSANVKVIYIDVEDDDEE